MKNTISILIALSVLSTGLFSTAPAAERVSLNVFANNLDTIPIAILPFKGADGAVLTSDLPWQIIADDLAFMGRFKVLKAESVDNALFAANKVILYVDGGYSIVGGSVALDCYVHDATSRDLLVGKKYTGEKVLLRNMAHRFSNQVVEMLFGEKGIFESRILFVKKEPNQKNLFIMDFDGRNERRVTNTNTVNVFPAFVDTTTIIWTSFLRGKPDLYKANLATGKSQIFIYSRYIQTSPAVSGVVGKIAYACSKTGNLEIYTCDMDAAEGKRLTFTKAVNTSPCWSPNGYQIAFTSDRTGSPQIFIMDADGANVKRLTYQGGYQDSPAWSPKGDRIAYASMIDGKFDIWTIGPDGSKPARVTSNSGANVAPSWSADGNFIVFASSAGTRTDLYAVHSDGSGLKRLTTSGCAEMPEWSPF